MPTGIPAAFFRKYASMYTTGLPPSRGRPARRDACRRAGTFPSAASADEGVPAGAHQAHLVAEQFVYGLLDAAGFAVIVAGEQAALLHLGQPCLNVSLDVLVAVVGVDKHKVHRAVFKMGSSRRALFL